VVKKVNKKNFSGLITILALVVFSVALIFAYYRMVTQSFLGFSDAAKFADIARNQIGGYGYTTDFITFAPKLIRGGLPVYAWWIPPIMPWTIAAAFKVFGVSDPSIIADSSFFFLGLIITTFFLGKRLFGDLTGILAAVGVAVNIHFLDYATSGASETLFAFEIILGAYLLLLRKKWADILGAITLLALYFTRPQGFIYIAGLILLWLLLRFPIKKATTYFLVIIVVGIFVDYFILTPLSGRYFLYPILGRASYVLGYTPGASSSELLRGVVQQASVIAIFKKVFYNLYNFYRLLPDWASPYMWALFIIGLFKWGKEKVENSLKVATIFIVVITFLVTALTIPLFRYLHPVIPLVYLFAVSTLVWIISQTIKDNRKIVIISSVIVFLFVVGQTLGVIFLDSRYKAKTVNMDKPPVYAQLSWILRDNTKPEDLVITNLDTWGSWYGERRTVWYPIKPGQLDLKNASFDVIYLTSYLMDDENYYMGPEWRQMFLNPKNIKDKYISENYKFVKEFSVSADETYEKQSARAVLLIRK